MPSLRLFRRYPLRSHFNTAPSLKSLLANPGGLPCDQSHTEYGVNVCPCAGARLLRQSTQDQQRCGCWSRRVRGSRGRKRTAHFADLPEHGCRDDQRGDMPMELLALGQQIVGRLDGAAPLVPQHHHQVHPQVLHGVFEAAQRDIIRRVPGHPDHKEIAEPLVKDDLGRNA